MEVEAETGGDWTDKGGLEDGMGKNWAEMGGDKADLVDEKVIRIEQ